MHNAHVCVSDKFRIFHKSLIHYRTQVFTKDDIYEDMLGKTEI